MLSLSCADIAVTKTTAHYNILIEDEDAEITWLLNYSTAIQNLKLTLTFTLPENATIISISDLHGPILNYDVVQLPSGDEITLQTRNDGQGGPLSLTIKYSLKNIAPQKYGRLRISYPLCLSITDESSADLTLPPDAVLISSSPASKQGSRTAHFNYLGQCLIFVYKRGTEFEDQGGYDSYSTTHYEVFSRELSQDVKKAALDVEDYYWLHENITGIQPPYEKWTIIFTPHGQDIKGEAGVYVGSGLIFIREDALDGELAPLIVHETIHGFNSKPLHWDVVPGSFWFEEGTATYGAHLYSLEKGIEEPDFFVKNSDYYTSTYEELANYYERDSSYMEVWDFELLDQFSYDYSQFIIRSYIDSYGTKALRQTYACLSRVPEDTADPLLRNENILDCMVLAAANGTRESILYPYKELYQSDEHTFERLVARIGSGDWRGEEKPLSSSAYDLPPLPYELEAADELAIVEADLQAAPAFTSSNAQSLLAQATSEYELARSLFEQERYKESLAASKRASEILQLAYQAEEEAMGQPFFEDATMSACAPAFPLFTLFAFTCLRRGP